MFKSSDYRFNWQSLTTFFLFSAALLLAPLTASCSSFISELTPADALKVLRDLTKNGKLPPESVVLEIENRYADTETGALAKLLRARIRFENNDFAGAAQILNADVLRQNTKLGDYAAWLRGRALQNTGNHAEAMKVFAALMTDFPTSLRVREAKILRANSALQSGQAAQIPGFLSELNQQNDADALLLTAKSYAQNSDQINAAAFYRKTYFYAAGTDAAKEAEAQLTALKQPLTPNSPEEIQIRAEQFYKAKNYAEAAKSFDILAQNYPAAINPPIQLKRLVTFANLKRMSDAQSVFNYIPAGSKEKERAFYELSVGYAKNRLWANARSTADLMRQTLPKSDLNAKTLIDSGLAARDAKNNLDAQYFFKSAVTAYPNAVEVAQAQFELAWIEHANSNFQTSSQMLTEHLARYVDKDSTNRGKAGYWAARDSERAGKIPEACALYDAVNYRYAANWYGYLAAQKSTSLRGGGQCRNAAQFPANSLIPKAVTNLKTVTVAPETATAKELERGEKSEELATVGLFDWAVDELAEAQKTAPNSPKINLALAKYYRLKGDNTAALLALAKSYPDFSQMFPEELSREEWDIFYPLTNWSDIKYWARQRSLDSFQVAGFIRQETIFNPTAKSGANAYGLMQLLIPTARVVARKYNSSTQNIDGATLFQPALNIELGTAYIRDQFDKFGRVEFVAVAYNAGPGRVPQWQATLPAEMDEFVEAIPFKETKGYVQGIIRNSAQYRRLYDDNGSFKPNVGAKPLRGEIDTKPREQFAQEFPEIVLETKGE